MARIPEEYAIIVVGVLTALGAEQAAEWLHVRGEVAEAREALREEISNNAAVELRAAAEDRCGMNNYERAITWAKGGPKSPWLPGLLDAPATTVWEAQRGGAITHMPTKERLAYAAYYDRVGNQNRGGERQLSVLTQFASLLALDRLSPGQAERLIETAGIARLMNATKVANALELVQTAKSLGVKPAAIPADLRDYVIRECRTYGAPPPNFSDDQPIPSFEWWAKAGMPAGAAEPERPGPTSSR